jgi:hypothetical protein
MRLLGTATKNVGGSTLRQVRFVIPMITTLWMSEEIQADIADEYALARKDVEAALEQPWTAWLMVSY